MRKLHVVLKKEELDPDRLDGKVVVALDILFATSTIATAFAHGVRRVLPTADGAAALRAAEGLPAGSFVLSGELDATTLPGFAHPTPLALMRENLAGRTLVYSTTNGTVALARARRASRVYAAALLNAAAVVRAVVERHADETILIVCSGSADNFNLEDFYGAGYLVSLFRSLGCAFEATDAAVAAGMFHDGVSAIDCLTRARVGKLMLARGLEAEVEFAARKSCFDHVPVLAGDFLVDLGRDFGGA